MGLGGRGFGGSRAEGAGPWLQTLDPRPYLEVSWVDKSRVISRVTILVTHIRGPMNLQVGPKPETLLATTR